MSASAERLSTRERILDVALELFIDKGYDKASLREIAEPLGISKAALYYHFPTKDAILLALHLRLHELYRRVLSNLDSHASGPGAWRAVLDQFVDEMLANRRLFMLQERNAAALERLHEHNAQHASEHDDLDELVRGILSDRSVPLRDRTRLACALGAAMSALLLAGSVVSEAETQELGSLVREAVHDVLSSEAPQPRKPRTRG